MTTKTEAEARKWHTALCALVQRNEGKPLADLLRKCGEGRFEIEMPLFVPHALADMFDPQVAHSPYAKPRLPPDKLVLGDDGKPLMFVPRLRFVLGDDGKPIPYSGDDGRPTPRLKAAIEYEAAWMAVLVECERLAASYNKGHTNKLEKWDVDELEAFATEIEDKKARGAFASYRGAGARLSAEQAAINPAVKLRVEELSKERLDHLRRNDRIVAEMLHAVSALGKSVDEASEYVGARQVPRLSGSLVIKIWAKARKATPYLKRVKRGGFPTPREIPQQ